MDTKQKSGNSSPSEQKFLFGVTEHVVCLFTSPRRQGHTCNFSGGNDLLNSAKSHPEGTCKQGKDSIRNNFVSVEERASCRPTGRFNDLT